MNKKVVIGFSCGDINGVGLEVFIKAFLNHNLFDICVPILYVPQKVLQLVKKKFHFNDFHYKVIKDPKEVTYEKVNIISFFDDQDIELSIGQSTEIAAQIAIKSIDLALNDLNKNLIKILLTLPVNKQNVSLVKKDFKGHTEYVSKNCKTKESLMLLCNNNLRIATVTNHIPIYKVSAAINKTLLERKIILLLQALKRDFLISKPKIAVLGLNPHGGDGGLIGTEDMAVVSPVIESFFNKGALVYGPYSADGFFGSRKYQSFDAVLGMYHDQSLIPFKTISFGSGVNYTAGLPVIRLSPDHGVGYDIAGKNIADTNSLLSAMSLGVKIYYNRKSHVN